MQDYRPVAAKDNTIFSKSCKYMFNIGSQGISLPVERVGFGDQTAHLTKNIGRGGQFRDLLTPGFSHMSLNIWFGDVIEHKSSIGTLLYKLNGTCELAVIDTNITGKAI